MKKKMLTVKVKFNFEGIKHEASRAMFPEHYDRDNSFITFLTEQYKIAITKYVRGEQ